MCFTPLASLSTAIIEFLIVGYLLIRARERRFYPLIAFVFLLGLYQFTEFMLCSGFSTDFWARLGFIAYTFMPVTIMHLFINLTKVKIKIWYYVIPIFFSAISLLVPGFIYSTSCNLLHVSVENLVFHHNLVLLIIYMAYYALYPGFGLYLFFSRKRKKKVDLKSFKVKFVALTGPLGVVLAQMFYILTTMNDYDIAISWFGTASLVVFSSWLLILGFYLARKRFYVVNLIVLGTASIVNFMMYQFIPRYASDYASIFCQFAILYAIGAVLLVESLRKKNQ